MCIDGCFLDGSRAVLLLLTIDSVMKVEKNYLQVYLEEYKCRVKKKKMSKLIDVKLKSISDSE